MHSSCAKACQSCGKSPTELHLEDDLHLGDWKYAEEQKRANASSSTGQALKHLPNDGASKDASNDPAALPPMPSPSAPSPATSPPSPPPPSPPSPRPRPPPSRASSSLPDSNRPHGTAEVAKAAEADEAVGAHETPVAAHEVQETHEALEPLKAADRLGDTLEAAEERGAYETARAREHHMPGEHTDETATGPARDSHAASAQPATSPAVALDPVRAHHAKTAHLGAQPSRGEDSRPGPCQDSDPNFCREYVSENRCADDLSMSLALCRKSCNLCQSSEGAPSSQSSHETGHGRQAVETSLIEEEARWSDRSVTLLLLVSLIVGVAAGVAKMFKLRFPFSRTVKLHDKCAV